MVSQSFPNKSYKIDPFFNMVFFSCLSLYQRDKLTEFLIKAYFNFEGIEEMPRYKKGELLAMMIEDIKKSGKSIHSFLHYLNNERVVELRKISIDKGVKWSDNRIVVNARISEETQNMITELGKGLDTIGEVIEIAIAYFISTCKDTYYQMIKFAFKNHISG